MRRTLAVVALWLVTAAPASAWQASAPAPTKAQPQASTAAPVPSIEPTAAERLAKALRAGRTANGLSKFAEAETAFREALELQTGAAKGSDEAVAATLLDLALNVSNQGHYDQAAGLFRRAEPLLQTSANAGLRARLATYQAIDATNRNDVTAAARYAGDAVEQWRSLMTRRQTQSAGADNIDVTAAAVEESEFANALNLLARLQLKQDNLLAAYGAASQALLILNKSTVAPRWWKADSLVALGEISIAQGRLSAAESYFDAALKLRRQLFGDGVPTIRVLLALGRAYQREGLNSSTIVTYREVFRLARALPSTAGVFTADMLVPFAAAVVATAETIKDPEQRRGLFAEAFDAFQLVQSPVVDQTIAQAAARLSAANPAISTLIGEVQDHERAADMARVKLAYEQSLPDSERSSVEEDRLKAEAAAQLAATVGARRALNTQFPDYDALVAPRAMRLDRLRAMLLPHEGLVSFLIGHDRSFAQLVTRDGVLVAAVPEGEQALRETVTALRRPLEIQGGAIAEFNLGEASRLHDELLGGLKPGMAGLDHLVVVPAGPLSNLPFGLLVASPIEGASYEKADWLVRTRTIAYTPSLQAFGQLRTAKPAAAPTRPLLGFGDPTLAGHGGGKAETAAMTQMLGSCREGGPMPAALLRALAPLPDTARELNAVARALGAPTGSLFLEGEATETNLRRQTLTDYRVLYFATHGLLPGELRCQAEPGLVLTPPAVTATTKAADGLLETSEIASLRLNADLVVLSACNTAAGSGGEGGGAALSGLAEAFFHAGARNMVVSHWQVPSAATTELMTGMFKAWSGTGSGAGSGGGENVGDALRHSQLALIANPRTAHPFFWAAFVAVGDGLGRPAGAGAVAAR